MPKCDDFDVQDLQGSSCYGCSDLDDDAAARNEAARALGEMVRDQLTGSEQADITIVVCRQDRTPVLKALIVYSIWPLI